MKSAALLFGLNYANNPKIGALNGCIHDVKNMAKWLETQGCTQVSCFDDEAHPDACNRRGILSHLRAFAATTQAAKEAPYDWVWIHYSGHGTQVIDLCEEEDLKDEAIVPSDADRAGYITDDDLFKILNSFHPSTRVIVMMDACHSGTICDLPYVWDIETEIKRIPITPFQVKMTGPVVLLSGCRDDQTSDDAYNLAEARYGGAFTDAFLSVVTVRPEAVDNIFSLLTDVRKILKLKRHSQVVQLSSSVDFSVRTDLFSLATPSSPAVSPIQTPLQQQQQQPSRPSTGYPPPLVQLYPILDTNPTVRPSCGCSIQ